MSQRAGLSDYLAAERTFLAWIRAGLALMGFGLSWRASGFSCNSSGSSTTLLQPRLTEFLYGSVLH